MSEQTAPHAPAGRRSNRGFWLVAGTMLAACVVLVVAIVANRGTKDAIAHGEHSLRTASAAAQAIFARDGSYAAADAAGLAQAEPSLDYVGPAVASDGLDRLSVAASDEGWAASVQVRPGACFYLRLAPGEQTFYGVGTDCRALAALGVTDGRW